MRKCLVATLAIVALSASGIAGCKKEEKTEAPPTTPAPVTAPVTTATTTPAPPAPATAGMTGAELFKQYCAVCHPDGGNTINPKKTLNAKAMAQRSKITKAEDIVRVMRNPGPGMNKFDEATVSDENAKKIGEYVLATFK
jgi:cytochrome c6